MISLTNHDSSEGEQWGRYNLPRYSITITPTSCVELHPRRVQFWETEMISMALKEDTGRHLSQQGMLGKSCSKSWNWRRVGVFEANNYIGIKENWSTATTTTTIILYIYIHISYAEHDRIRRNNWRIIQLKKSTFSILVIDKCWYSLTHRIEDFKRFPRASFGITPLSWRHWLGRSLCK